MTSPKPQERPWFQLHLSTLVLIMLTLGFVVSMNDPLFKRKASYFSEADGYVQFRLRGFPLAYRNGFAASGKHQWESRVKHIAEGDSVYVFKLVFNIAFSVVCIGAMGFGAEWWIRDRKRRDQWWFDSQEATKNVPDTVRRLKEAKQSANNSDNPTEKER